MYNLQLLVRGILRLWRMTVGRSLILAVASWFALVLAWLQTEQGSFFYKVFASNFMPSMRTSEYLGSLTFMDSSSHRARLYISFLGFFVEVLLLTAVWYCSLRLMVSLRRDTVIEHPTVHR
jgi:hypothetical protein